MSALRRLALTGGLHQPQAFAAGGPVMLPAPTRTPAPVVVSSAATLPSTVTLVDESGALLGRMRVVAGQTIATEAAGYAYAGGSL